MLVNQEEKEEEREREIERVSNERKTMNKFRSGR